MTPGSVVVATHTWSPGWGTALDEHLRPRADRYLWISHPLFEGQGRSEFRLFEKGKLIDSGEAGGGTGGKRYLDHVARTVRWCSKHGKFDLFIAGDNLLAMAALWLRARRRVSAVVLYSIDFVPQRFSNPMLNRGYHAVDRLAVARSNVVWSTAQGVIEGRQDRDGRPARTPQLVVPIGAHTKRIAAQADDAPRTPTIAYLGHLLEKQGVQVVIEALPAVLSAVPEARLLVIGDGPHRQQLEALTRRLNLAGAVDFAGFNDDHQDIERRLLRCSIGVAPYVPRGGNYSQFQDLPGKIVTYLACGLPVLTTEVPRHARIVEEAGAGEVVAYDKDAFAKSMSGYLAHRDRLAAAREAAIRLARSYDWDEIFDRALAETTRLIPAPSWRPVASTPPAAATKGTELTAGFEVRPAGRAPRPVRESSFALVANGFADGPAQAMRDYLIKERARSVVTVNHPLSVEEGDRHVISRWTGGELVMTRKVRLPSRPPLTFPMDLVASPLLPAVDCWFGFNPLNVLHGLAARRMGRAREVVYWGVDFVEEPRFGRGPLTSVYEAAEGFACRHSDARFELSAAMRDGRNRRHGKPGVRLAPARIVPMGAWIEHVPECEPDAYIKRRVVYMGHLLPKQGLLALLDAISLVRDRGLDVQVDFIGRGPQESDLRARSRELRLDGAVRFHGFIEDHRQLEAMVAAGSIGVAPYATGTASSYTVFSDPGKLKIYLAAGLPIVTTDAAPVAAELGQAGAAAVVEFTPAAIADAIHRLLTTPAEWSARRRAALDLALTYDWRLILSGALRWLGYE